MERAFNECWHSYENKPIEVCPLTANHGNGVSQKGTMRCWIDILSTEEAEDEEAFPLWDITPPPKEKFELRVVIWDCIDCKIMDEANRSSDLYVNVILTGIGIGPNVERATDTHLFAKAKKNAERTQGSFNYRLIFPVQYSIHYLESSRLQIQLYDAELGSDNLIGVYS